VRVGASDVANFIACQELTQLDLRAAQRTLRPPHPRGLGFEDLVRRGHPCLHDSATGMTNERLERALRDGELDVAAGTAWLERAATFP
jgi:hypothetical protein